MKYTKYRVITSGKAGRLHKSYFRNYDRALDYFQRTARRLNRYAYAELQELEAGAYLTVEQSKGGSFYE